MSGFADVLDATFAICAGGLSFGALVRLPRGWWR